MNKAHPLSNVEIETYFNKSKYKNKWGACISKDEINQVRRNKCYVINLADSDKPGSHWVAVIDLNPKHCHYFDPFGVIPPTGIMNWMKGTKTSRKRCYYSTLRIQDIKSIECGYYCIKLIEEMMKDSSIENFIDVLYSMK